MATRSRDDLSSIVGVLSAESERDTECREESVVGLSDQQVEDLRSMALDNDIKKEGLEGKKQDRAQRKEFADMIFRFVEVYMLCVLGLLIMAGVGDNNFSLSDGVLIAILGTTTANVIGVFNFVAKYLFHR